jgi:hypothetical protein
MVVFVFVGVGYNGKVRAGGFEVVGRQNIELQAPTGPAVTKVRETPWENGS